MDVGLNCPIVGVICSGSKPHQELAEELAQTVAARKWNLLTGGGGGAMTAVTAAYNQCTTRGLSIAVLPKGQTNVAGAELVLQTNLPGTKAEGGYLDGRSRNYLNVRLSDLIVALPGSDGTQSELTVAAQYGRPCIAYLGASESIGELERTPDGFWIVQPRVPVAKRIDEVKAFFDQISPRTVARVSMKGSK